MSTETHTAIERGNARIALAKIEDAIADALLIHGRILTQNHRAALAEAERATARARRSLHG